MYSPTFRFSKSINLSDIITGNTSLELLSLFVSILSCTFILVNNLSSFLSYVLQATNRIKEYSFSRVIDTVFFLIFLVLFLIIKVADFRYYVIIYLLGRFVGLVYCGLEAKEILWHFIYQKYNN